MRSRPRRRRASSRVELAAQLVEVFDRLLEYLAPYEVFKASARIDQIIQAINALETNSMPGRPARNETRELMIGRQSRGYVAL